MKRLLFTLSILCLMLQTTVRSGEAQEDGKMIEGTWLPVEAELSGQKFPDEYLKTMKLTMTDGRYTVKVGEVLDKGIYKLDPAVEPKAIDISGEEGPNKGKAFPAIYALIGDSLRICYDLEGRKRPTAFKTENNTQQFLVTYRREKP